LSSWKVTVTLRFVPSMLTSQSKVSPFLTVGLCPSLQVTSLTFLAPYPLASSPRIWATPVCAALTSSLVVTKKPGFQNPSTRTTATIKTANPPTMAPMVATDFFDPCSVPVEPYGSNGCP
jgi:hypothetical protein